MRALITPEGLRRLDEAIDHHILYPDEYRPGQWIAQAPAGPVQACTAGRVVLLADAAPRWKGLPDCSCSDDCVALNGGQVASHVYLHGDCHHVQCLATQLLGIDGVTAQAIFAGFNGLAQVIGYRNTLAHSIGTPPMRLPSGVVEADLDLDDFIAVFASPELLNFMRV